MHLIIYVVIYLYNISLLIMSCYYVLTGCLIIVFSPIEVLINTNKIIIVISVAPFK